VDGLAKFRLGPAPAFSDFEVVRGVLQPAIRVINRALLREEGHREHRTASCGMPTSLDRFAILVRLSIDRAANYVAWSNRLAASQIAFFARDGSII
jgi:hypothetical protein